MTGSFIFAVLVGVFITCTCSFAATLENEESSGESNNTITGRISNAPVRFLLRPTELNSNSTTNSFKFSNNRVNNNEADRQIIRPISETTGLTCSRPGAFVPAPDGCNRCYCDRDGQLTARCSRAYCPPGFPSGPIRRNRQK